MKKFLIASDSFKGTLSSQEIGEIFSKKCQNIFPDSKVIIVPVADGGEGTVHALKNFLKGKLIKVNSLGPNKQKLKGTYLIKGKDAYVEVASSCGLSLAKPPNPMITTSYGSGLEILHAIKQGAKHIFIGLGGSSTNDGGAGILNALGVKFLDKNNQEFLPVGNSLNQISDFNIDQLRKNIKGIKFTLLSDVTNPFTGSKGASKIFAKQKGANQKQIEILENNMKYFAKIISQKLNQNINKIPGAGAAGGIGGGLFAFLNAEIKSGVKTILEIINFNKLIKGCDFVFTGEGKLDSQSFDGKLISGVLSFTKKQKIPTIAICGTIDKNLPKNYLQKFGLYKAFASSPTNVPFSKIKKKAKKYYEKSLEINKSTYHSDNENSKYKNRNNNLHIPFAPCREFYSSPKICFFYKTIKTHS